jgi:hypothetical protein
MRRRAGNSSLPLYLRPTRRSCSRCLSPSAQVSCSPASWGRLWAIPLTLRWTLGGLRFGDSIGLHRAQTWPAAA